MSTEQTIPSKRQLEEEPGEAETSTGVRRRLHGGEDEHTDDKAKAALSKPSHYDSTAPAAAVEAQPEAGPSTLQSASRGKNKKVPLSRKEAREARKSNNTRRGTRPERTDGEEGRKKKESSEPRLPKRQCALLLGFCGSGYSGMQFQPHSKTIEGTFFDALVRAGAVSQDNADSISKVNFSRAARTDAGVHAAGNVVAMKLITTIPGVSDIVARINEELPPEIRLWGFERVLKSFNARNTCDSRKYTYYFPSYLLIPPKPGSGQHKILSEHLGGTSVSPSESTSNPGPLNHPFWKAAAAESTKEEDLTNKRTFRAPEDAIERLRATVKKYEGSHNFHNFTVGREYNDRSCVRVMKKIEVADPVVQGSTEWIAVMFHGQSFMLHQRKMMAALVLSCRTNTPPEVIDELYGPRTVFVPKMPALGLLLEYPIFESYNKRIQEASDKLQPSDPDYRRPVDFEVYRDKIDAFKQEHIYSRMHAIEEQGGVFDAWIRSVDAYAGNDLLYLNPKGVVPDIAIIKRGEKRTNPFREKKQFDATTFPAGVDVGKLMAEEEEKDAEEEEEADEKLNKKELAEMEG